MDPSSNEPSAVERAFRLVARTETAPAESWLVEPSLHRIRRLDPDGRRGDSAQVEPKVLAVLVELAREPGAVVSQERLRERVWDGGHVSDEVVRRAVYELRKILGEEASAPRFIETVPRAGYRLIAAVEPREKAPGPSGRAGVRRGLRAAVAALLVVVPVVAFLVFFASERPAPPDTPHGPAPRITPLTALPGLEYDPAWSPDGSRIAFARAAPDGSDIALHVQVVGEGEPLRLVDGGEQPCWSPDGRRIRFVAPADASDGVGGADGVARGGRRWEIRSVPALGGPSRLVEEAGAEEPYGLACSPDGRFVAYGWAERPQTSYRIVLLDLETGERRFLTDPPPGISGDGEPAFSPDGRRIAFLRNHYGLIQDVYTVPVPEEGSPENGSSRPAEKRISRMARKMPDVAWSPDGEDLFFTLYGGGDHRLWRVSAEGGEAEPVPVGEGAMTLSLDAAGGRLAYTRYAFKFRFWRVALPSGEAEPLPLLSSTRFDSEVAVAPDGDRLAFISTRSGDFEVWVSDRDAASPRRLTAFRGATVREPSWSPDGRWIAFAAAVDGDADVWRIDPRGGLPERLTTSPAQDVAPWWSRDGRWLYFASNRSGRWEIWRRPAAALEQERAQSDPATGSAEQVTRGGGHRGAESPDGRWLYFTRRGEGGLWRRALEPGGVGGEAELVLPDLSRHHDGNWAVLADGILFATKDEAHHAMLARSLPGADEAAGRVEPVAPLEDWPMNPSFALAPDGSWLIYSQGYDVESDILLAENVF